MQSVQASDASNQRPLGIAAVACLLFCQVGPKRTGRAPAAPEAPTEASLSQTLPPGRRRFPGRSRRPGLLPGPSGRSVRSVQRAAHTPAGASRAAARRRGAPQSRLTTNDGLLNHTTRMTLAGAHGEPQPHDAHLRRPRWPARPLTGAAMRSVSLCADWALCTAHRNAAGVLPGASHPHQPWAQRAQYRDTQS